MYNLGSGADPARSGSIFAAGLSPSATLFSLAFSSRDLIDDFNKKLQPGSPASNSYTFEELGDRMIVPIPGLLLYLLLSGAFWALSRMQFRRFTRGKFLQDPRTKRQDHAVSSEEAMLQPAG